MLYYHYVSSKSCNDHYGHYSIKILYTNERSIKIDYADEIMSFNAQNDVEQYIPYGYHCNIRLSYGEPKLSMEILKKYNNFCNHLDKQGKRVILSGHRAMVKTLKHFKMTRVVYSQDAHCYVPYKYRKHAVLWVETQKAGLTLHRTTI